MKPETADMLIKSPNATVELLARIRYGWLPRLRIVERPARLSYHRRRWYLHDSRQQVQQIAKTYFDLMQPRA